MVLDCEICQISMQSEKDLLQHLQGKKHLKNVKNAELRDHRKRCSVYVRGFPPSVNESEVRKYFSKFGNITKISKKEHFAFLEFANEKDAQRVIKCKTHNLDGYTMVAKTVNKDKQKQGSTTLKISKSQSKTERKMKKKKALAENMKLKETQEDQRNQAILEMLEKAGSIDEQMHMLKQSMELTKDDFQERNDICRMLLEVLKPYFPGSTLHQFGSSVNGFGVKGCDLDLFLDFNDDKIEHACSQQTEPIHLPYVCDISSLKKSCGPLYAEDLQPMSLFDKVKLVSRILCEKAPGCSEIFCIPSTRCPVVRFVHRPSGMKCDLSVNNRLALRNTQLLALYSNVDERVKLLVYTIRYWAKFHKIAGNESSGPRLTNYALTLLVVYFLQNTSPPVLHSPQILADLAVKRTVIDGWDCSFNEDFSKIPKSENNSSSAQLLANFFHFFAQIEFNAAVLQCRLAKPKLLTDFAKEMSCSAKISNFKFGPLSVQDPFVLEHNVTLNVNEKTKLRILEQFRVSSKFCREWSKKLKKDPSVDVDNKLWGLMTLFDRKTTCQTDISDSSKNSKDDAKYDSSLYHFPIEFKMSMLSETAFKQLQAKGDYRYHWCLHVISFLKKLLSDILLIEVELEYSSLKSPEEFSSASEKFCDEVQKALTESMSETSLASVPLSASNPERSQEAEELDTKSPWKQQEAGPICDVIRGKRLSSDSLNDADSKRCRTCVDVDDCDVANSNVDANDKTTRKESVDNGEKSECVNSKNGSVSEKTTVKMSHDMEGIENCSDSDLGTLCWMCTSECATFNGRKTVRREVILEGHTENLDLEREVSKRILQKIMSDTVNNNEKTVSDHTAAKTEESRTLCKVDSESSAKDETCSENVGSDSQTNVSKKSPQKNDNLKSKLAFKCILRPVLQSGSTSVLVNFEPLENKKQFSCFYQFLKTFVLKMVDRYLFTSSAK